MSDQIALEFGLETIASYKRLDYTAWHALAEFVDNSTQSYFDNRKALDKAYKAEGEALGVNIVHDKEKNEIRISDNAMGMDRKTLERALLIGTPPEDRSGRSRYGLGMKTAASWLGDKWTIRTKKLGETTEYEVTIDVPKIAAGDNSLPTREKEKGKDEHYTIIEIGELHKPLVGRTKGKVPEFLASMYRVDLSEETLELRWQGKQLSWDEPFDFLESRDGVPYKRAFDFKVNGKRVKGWAGILLKGSRAKAGFAILHSNRVIKGPPQAWRPGEIFGQMEGSNDLVNQRIVGEVYLDDFEVTHTKDNIVWEGDDEDEVETKLAELIQDYVEIADKWRKTIETGSAPSDVQVAVALDELKEELSSREMADLITIETVPPPEVIEQSEQPIVEAVTKENPDFIAEIDSLKVNVYLGADISPNDPYVLTDIPSEENISVIINMQHPHVLDLKDDSGLLNYFRHCTYDALAEWKASKSKSPRDPGTIKRYKDNFLRVSMKMRRVDNGS